MISTTSFKSSSSTATAIDPSLRDPAHYRALVHPPGKRWIEVIDQRALPHVCTPIRIANADGAAMAIRRMWIRGAPLIGAVGAYGMALALDADADDASLVQAYRALDATRPTAVNLRWALERVRSRVAPLAPELRADAAWDEADAIVAEDVAINHAIGQHGLRLLRELATRRSGAIRILTHCNAGALATCGWGTATAPIFMAQNEGMAVHVFVSETRPRLQGANLTTWELRQRGVPHSLLADSASALLLQRREIDLVVVGADRVARNGDTGNKIGTYPKALAAHDSAVPFYVALPSPTLDANLADGHALPIESREADEVLSVIGVDDYGHAARVSIAPAGTHAINYAFDVTPARLIAGYITERGIATGADGLARLFPERLA